MRENGLMKNIIKNTIKGFAVIGICVLAGIFAPGSVKTQALEYDAETNQFKPQSQGGVVDYIFVLKSEKGTKYKSAKMYSFVDRECYNWHDLSELGIKPSNKKDVYLFEIGEYDYKGKEWDLKAPETLDANFVIKAPEASKVTGVIDYTQADFPDSTTVLSITALDNAKREIKNPTCEWCQNIDGTYKPSGEFTGAELARMLKDSVTEIYVRMPGKNMENGVALFASKPAKVKIAKPAKAPKLKIDVLKDTVGISNGYDYAIVFSDDNGKTFSDPEWHTVLPYLKTAKIKTLDDSIVYISQYKPVNKNSYEARNDYGKVSFTSFKVKSLTFAELFEHAGWEDESWIECYIALRKSATLKKPASEISYTYIPEQTEAPIVFTETNVDRQYRVTTSSEFDKKGFLIGTVENYNGYAGTEGFADSFKLTSQPDEDADKNPAKYESVVVNVKDLANIDWKTVKWKKLDPAKTKINSKLKTKYSTYTQTGITATLSAGSAPNEYEEKVDAGRNKYRWVYYSNNWNHQSVRNYELKIPSTVSTVLLIRRAGVKGQAPVRASEYIALFVIKNGSTYELYSTRCNGMVAYPYTVDFYKFKANEAGTGGEFVKDTATESIKGWGLDGDTVKLSFPAITDAKFYSVTENNGKVTPNQVLAPSDGKYEITVDDEESLTKVIIREYANVTFNVVYGTVKDDKFTPLGNNVAGSVQTIKFVKKGIESMITEETPVAGSSAPCLYVGSSHTFTECIAQYVIPDTDTYQGVGVRESSATGTGYAGFAYSESGGKSLTITPLTANDIVVNIEFEIRKKSAEQPAQNQGGEDPVPVSP